LSKIALSGNASGTGTLTIAAPNTNTDRTLTLPDNTGTILTNATTAGFPAGSVLQVVQATTGTDTTITATSYTDITNLSVSITPTSASSKILVLVQISGRYYTNQNDNRIFYTNIVRGSTQIHEISTDELQSGVGAGSFAIYPALSSLIYLDSPATTSSTTYKVQAKVNNAVSATAANFNGTDGVSTITLMEIAA
jgi:hypothetical protein